MRGRDANHAGVGGQPLDNKSLCVDRDGDHARAGRLERAPHRREHRVLDGNLCLAGRHQDARQNIERLPGAGGDDDIIARTGDGSGKRHVMRDRLT